MLGEKNVPETMDRELYRKIRGARIGEHNSIIDETLIRARQPDADANRVYKDQEEALRRFFESEPLKPENIEREVLAYQRMISRMIGRGLN